MLQDWDPQSTLLRHAVQGNARQLPLRPDDPVTIAERTTDLVEGQRRIVARAQRPAPEWVSRYLLAPVEQSGARLLMPSSVSPNMLYGAAAALTGLAAILFTDGWLWPGLLVLLAATPLDAIARKLAALRMQPGAKPRWWKRGAPAVAGAALLALAFALAPAEGWGCFALAAAAIAFLVAMDGERAGPDVPGRLFLAERKGMSWLLLPFALGGAWVTGLGALALYAAGSFFWVQRQVHGAAAPVKKD